MNEPYIKVDGSKWVLDPKSPDGLRWEPTFWESMSVLAMVAGMTLFTALIIWGALTGAFDK